MKERKLIGHVIWKANPEHFDDYEVEMTTTAEESKTVARKLLDNLWPKEPETDQDDPRCRERKARNRKKYLKNLAKIERLEDVRLSEYREIVFQKVYAYVDSGPDMSMIGPISEKMQAIYSKHEETWLAMSETERTDFLARFSDYQKEWSNLRQFHFCLDQGISYRHVLHEMKCRGIPDHSFIKADYSLLFYLEDYDGWEAWTQRQEASLMERNVHTASVPGTKPLSDPVTAVSGII